MSLVWKRFYRLGLSFERRTELVERGGRVAVALSGGVDSSVVAYLLKQAGRDVVAIFMKNWEEEGSCPAEQDLKDATQVCKHLDIPLYSVNFSTEYWDEVFDEFLKALARGETPNPDVLCNRHIKFATCWRFARDQLGCRALATGHYARVHPGPSGPRLFKALDDTKDQSYFLHAVSASQLQGVEFPLGALQKSQVRALARSAGLCTAQKRDSTGICFIGEKPFSAFLRSYLPPKAGLIVDEAGTILGEHSGLHFFTLGQRKGLGLGGMRGRSAAPWYVLRKESASGRLVVTQEERHAELWPQHFGVRDLHWIRGEAPSALQSDGVWPCAVKVRYRQPEARAYLVRGGEGESRALVRLEKPLWAVTPGQYAVFYSRDEVLGGGVIELISETKP